MAKLACPFQKLLIANRGEIACRIAKTARKLGLTVISVYSEADTNAIHTRLADIAYPIGKAPAIDSYLNFNQILNAAKATGAEAIHPGYGFLSENHDFAEACEAAELIFIGPSAETMRAMGSKSAAKRIMAQAGVPTVPGYHGDAQDAETFHNEALRIGFPILLKAAAGGGGKGLRTVFRQDDLKQALLAVKREAKAAFGNDAVLLEKYIEHPRHLEVQIFGDNHGNVVSLFERECTLQRRHQKVIEEAPSPTLSRSRREALLNMAQTAAKAVNYTGAGTIEFVANQEHAYFIEMNTRLQVEHPVTEMITGLDLVEWQLRVAMDEPLPLKQDEITFQGHAIEARVYAEDPNKGFLPSIGRIDWWRMPEKTATLRIDTGFDAGETVSHYYDPLLAKVIAWAPTRERALGTLETAIAACEIGGVTTNIPFLKALLNRKEVRENAIDTGTIERIAPSFRSQDLSDWGRVAACAAVLHAEKQQYHRDEGLLSPWKSCEHFRLSGKVKREIVFTHQNTKFAVSLAHSRNVTTLFIDGGKPQGFSFAPLDEGCNQFRITLGGVQRTLTALFNHNNVTVFEGGCPFEIVKLDPFASAARATPQYSGIVAPMPGTVLALLAKPLDTLEPGSPILILEAMKMEHTLRSSSTGTIKSYLCEPGDFVKEGTMLVDFEPQGTL